MCVRAGSRRARHGRNTPHTGDRFGRQRFEDAGDNPTRLFYSPLTLRKDPRVDVIGNSLQSLVSDSLAVCVGHAAVCVAHDAIGRGIVSDLVGDRPKRVAQGVEAQARPFDAQFFEHLGELAGNRVDHRSFRAHADPALTTARQEHEPRILGDLRFLPVLHRLAKCGGRLGPQRAPSLDRGFRPGERDPTALEVERRLREARKVGRVEIPAVVTLLEPGRRRGDLEALLGEVKTAVMHTPDRYVPVEDESVPTSPRPRHAPEIEELGWELSSATHWRDGLPRLAHTLAKAASSGTGVDPSEVELLQQQMHDAGERVLDAYPDEIDPKHVGNWQLLSAIEALIRGDKVGANYHLAWFQACMTSPTGPPR